MSLLLKTTYIHVFTAFIIFSVYGFWIFGILGVEYFTGPDALVRIGKSIATLIVAGYAFEIIVTMLIVGKQALSSAMSGLDPMDERDKQILHKSMFNSHLVLCGGLFLSIAGLAMGLQAFWVFNTIVLAFLLSVIAELGTKLFFYHGAI